jgi:hypothetical protein
MEASLHTPLLDAFRRDEVSRDIRILAARGAVAPRALEQLALLMMLSTDRDSEIREIAEATIARLPQDLLSGFIARSDVPDDLRSFFVARGVPVAAVPLPDEPPTLVDTDDTDYGPEDTAPADKASIYARLAAMSVPEKVRAAMKGSREMRAILIRDPNKLVALSVLSGPKVSDMEVEGYARMGSVAEDVLRAIAARRGWMKNYSVVLALVRNAKTPVTITMNLLSRLREADLKRLSTDRNVPEALRIAARKKVVIGGST